MKQTKFTRRWFPRDPSRSTSCGLRELRGWTLFIAVCQILLHIAAVLFFVAFLVWPSRMHSLFHLKEPKFHQENLFQDADVDPENYIHKPSHNLFHMFRHHHMPYHVDKSKPIEKKSEQSFGFKSNPEEKNSNQLSAPKMMFDHPFFMKPKPIEQKSNQLVDKNAKQQPVSPRRTFHMLIFAQKRTMVMRDKEGKFHIGSFIKFSPPVFFGQQQQQSQPESEEKNLNQPRPISPLESRRQPHPHPRVARSVGSPSIESHMMHHHGMMHHHFQVKDHPKEHHGFWSSCKQNFRHQFHRQRLVAMILLTLLSLSFCCCLLYGSHSREPLLLLPYLGAQTICFGIYIMWMVNKFFHLSELRLSIASDTHSIFRRQLLSLSQTELVIVFSLGMLFHFLLQMTILAVVWSFFFRLRAEKRPKSLNLFYSHRHRRSVSDTAALLYDKVILEEDEDCDFTDEKKGEPGNLPKVAVPPPPYVKDEKMEDKKDSDVLIV